MAFCSVATQMIITDWQCDWMHDWLTDNSTMTIDVCKYVHMYVFALVDMYVCMCESVKFCILHISLLSFIIHGLGIYKTRRNFWLVFISSHHNFFFLCLFYLHSYFTCWVPILLSVYTLTAYKRWLLFSVSDPIYCLWSEWEKERQCIVIMAYTTTCK